MSRMETGSSAQAPPTPARHGSTNTRTRRRDGYDEMGRSLPGLPTCLVESATRVLPLSYAAAPLSDNTKDGFSGQALFHHRALLASAAAPQCPTEEGGRVARTPTTSGSDSVLSHDPIRDALFCQSSALRDSRNIATLPSLINRNGNHACAVRATEPTHPDKESR